MDNQKSKGIHTYRIVINIHGRAPQSRFMPRSGITKGWLLKKITWLLDFGDFVYTIESARLPDNGEK